MIVLPLANPGALGLPACPPAPPPLMPRLPAMPLAVEVVTPAPTEERPHWVLAGAHRPDLTILGRRVGDRPTCSKKNKLARRVDTLIKAFRLGKAHGSYNIFGDHQGSIRTTVVRTQSSTP